MDLCSTNVFDAWHGQQRLSSNQTSHCCGTQRPNPKVQNQSASFKIPPKQHSPSDALGPWHPLERWRDSEHLLADNALPTSWSVFETLPSVDVLAKKGSIESIVYSLQSCGSQPLVPSSSKFWYNASDFLDTPCKCTLLFTDLLIYSSRLPWIQTTRTFTLVLAEWELAGTMVT